MYTTAIFDMDGLLLDSERHARDAWETVLTELGWDFDHAFHLTVVGRNLADSRKLFRDRYGAAFDFDHAMGLVRELLDTQAAAGGIAVKPGAEALLTELAKRGIAKGVASSTPNEKIVLNLQLSGLLGHFSILTSGSEVKRGKPAPDIFLLAAERLGADPSRCLVFEDSSYGAMGALAAGMGVVVVPDLKAPTAEVGQRALRVLDSLEESLDCLDQWFGEKP